MRNFVHFLQYHNAIPVALGILVLGSGITFAATNPEAIYSSEQQVLSIDNTYLVNKDLTGWSPQIRINTVTEDEDNYYVAYSLTTIDIDGYAWKDMTKAETMTVSKADLGEYRDLGVYVTQQLRQIIDRERQRLADTQEIEKRQVSSATIATTYGGLIGQFIDDKTETLPGYTPVVVVPSSTAGGSFSGPAGDAASPQATDGAISGGSVAQVGLQVLGNNPARLALRSSYADLGVALLDPLNTNVGVHTFVDGAEVVSPQIDTSTTTAYTIEYKVTDLKGISVLVRRVVLVGDAPDPGGEVNEAGNVAPVVISAATPAEIAPNESANSTASIVATTSIQSTVVATSSVTTTQQSQTETVATSSTAATSSIESATSDVVPAQATSTTASSTLSTQ